jgi:hypothetical protein
LASTTDVDAMLGALESEKELCDTTEHRYTAALVVFAVSGEEDIAGDVVLQVLGEAACSSVLAGAVAIAKG